MTAPRIRRFEMGASALGMDLFLERLGYKIHGRADGGTFRVTMPNTKRAVTMHRTKLLALLDEARIAAGLEPIRARG